MSGAERAPREEQEEEQQKQQAAPSARLDRRVSFPSASTASSGLPLDRASGRQDMAGPGPGSLAGASPFQRSSLPDMARAAAPAFEPMPVLPPPRALSLPSVRPEPLSRALDTSALAHLPTDDSLGSLRERAQLALRAAAAAGEASQRAAAYAAAASSAASRAAEAAERAASAATIAQAGLENAAESAIMAAEARVAQASEAAKEAEVRAASAAAHATAYQDISQSQADIAERAAIVQRPAPSGPLSQLQQLWRSASSAFSQGQGHQQQGSSQAAANAPSASTSAQDGGRAEPDRSAAVASSSQATSPHTGSSPAESIGSTVKGILSWLGQGDGGR
ncbi:hypothetical protein GPECTOR_35g911 [Gonium pectorale]|uniref:Uncharacterized protein n=1 Tax=Gonium pectorale TaxID=33097 RepID=A0A150GCH7_GONPE|nr:hypothetical protein GPECTOR_35g911 [Gonium pectorale]|eukprot:KXZ47473.1 hypothetical protein GPECTOR_35g911 [Gonium pectorale]